MKRRCKDCGTVFEAREGTYGWCCPKCPMAHGNTEEVIDWETFDWVKAVDRHLGPKALALLGLLALLSGCAGVRRPLLPEPAAEAVVAAVELQEPAALPFVPAVTLGASVHRDGPGGRLLLEPAYLFSPTLDLVSLGPALGRRQVGLTLLGGFGGVDSRPLLGLGLSVCLTRPGKESALSPRLTVGLTWDSPEDPLRVRGVVGFTVTWSAEGGAST